MRALPPALLLAVLAGLAVAMPAAAEVRTETFRSGPIEVGGYAVKQNTTPDAVQAPKVDGFITGMEVDIVDRAGKVMPISRLMLHHIVFLNMGRTIGEKRDHTCGSGITGLDSKTVYPNVAERFYAAGEERAVMELPKGYGYKISKDDRWLMTWMLMNHRLQTDTAYVQWKVTYDTSPDLTAVTPYWLDVANCKADPIYDVPGGGKRGSRHVKRADWTPPQGGRIVAAGGHVHGGAHGLRLSQPACNDRTLVQSTPAWGMSDHDFYRVKPVLHEPGPIHMSATTSTKGIPFGGDGPLRLSSTYDAERPHTRAMGIMIAFVAPGEPADPCEPLPDDLRVDRTKERHRKAPPHFRVPLVGLDGKGRAVEIQRPRGRTVSMPRGGLIRVKDFAFGRPNVVVRRGATLRWRFDDAELHDVTVADGPRGFSSPHLSEKRSYSRKLGTKGTYKLFCSLHPVQMTETVKVR